MMLWCTECRKKRRHRLIPSGALVCTSCGCWCSLAETAVQEHGGDRINVAVRLPWRMFQQNCQHRVLKTRKASWPDGLCRHGNAPRRCCAKRCPVLIKNRRGTAELCDLLNALTAEQDEKS